MSSFLFYRQKAETDQTGELTSLKLPGRQWQVWDLSLPCCHTTFYIFIQASIRRADEIITHVTKSWPPSVGQNCSLEYSTEDESSVWVQRRGSYKKQKQKKIKSVNNSEPMLGLQGRKSLMKNLRRIFCFPC